MRRSEDMGLTMVRDDRDHHWIEVVLRGSHELVFYKMEAAAAEAVARDLLRLADEAHAAIAAPIGPTAGSA